MISLIVLASSIAVGAVTGVCTYRVTRDHLGYSPVLKLHDLDASELEHFPFPGEEDEED